nr:hypothetical protein Iba_chr11aCG10550 [Ipomoea batatas]GMD52291.1 hypothetical protein Iba_chr11bCG10510 [Ipomoea batatas]GMD54258.1 hypothetical protein Iba_chr11cCG10430 [Ipomoea batatas]GMD55957.1 hypothetical protein Iba_chr11dCG12960 [Ipomoea batatas]GME15358.1 hypothetical protein Iba_scaffold16146CG0030 [Ipomoea batatas]
MVLATAYSDAEGQMMNTKTPGRSIDIDFHHRAIRLWLGDFASTMGYSRRLGSGEIPNYGWRPHIELRYCYFVMWVEKASEDKASGYKNIQNKVYYVVQVQIQREYQ